MQELFNIKKEDIIFVSAKTGENVELLLKSIIKNIPPPKGSPDSPLRGLVFDAIYDEHRGVIAYVRIVDGNIRKGDRVDFSQSIVLEVKTKFINYLSHIEKD